jgi:hypothetical protein
LRATAVCTHFVEMASSAARSCWLNLSVRGKCETQAFFVVSIGVSVE